MQKPRRQYDREFKIEAVKLASRGDKTIAQITRDLGINTNLIARWKRQMSGSKVKDDPTFAFPGKGHLNPVDDELRRLRKQVRDLTLQRDILKKALAIFSANPDRNDDL